MTVRPFDVLHRPAGPQYPLPRGTSAAPPHRAILLAAITTCIGTASAQQRPSAALESNPLLRGWLVESLHHDVDRSAQLYAVGAQREDLGTANRALSAARLADIDVARGHNPREATSALRATLRELGVTPPELPALDPSFASQRADLEDARANQDPAARAAALARVREAVLAATAGNPPRPRGEETPSRSAFDAVRRAIAPDHAAESRERWLQEVRRTTSGFRRDWLEVVELVLSGRIEEADRVAWYRLRFRPEKPASDAISHVWRSLEMLEAAIRDRREGTRDREVLEQLRSRVRELSDRNAHAMASEMLRHIPYLPR